MKVTVSKLSTPDQRHDLPLSHWIMPSYAKQFPHTKHVPPACWFIPKRLSTQNSTPLRTRSAKTKWRPTTQKLQRNRCVNQNHTQKDNLSENSPQSLLHNNRINTEFKARPPKEPSAEDEKYKPLTPHRKRRWTCQTKNQDLSFWSWARHEIDIKTNLERIRSIWRRNFQEFLYEINFYQIKLLVFIKQIIIIEIYLTAR